MLHSTTFHDCKNALGDIVFSERTCITTVIKDLKIHDVDVMRTSKNNRIYEQNDRSARVL